MTRSRILLLTILLSCPMAAAAQTTSASPFGITDNSFLIEEAFNQEAGIFQNIFVMARNSEGAWDGSFTQEWPVPSQRHQMSFTLPFSVQSNRRALGDLALNYRFQVTTGEGRVPAFAPRLSLLAPTSNGERSLGWSGVGWQFNLPVSKQAGWVYFHANAGTTLLPIEEAGAKAREWSHAPFAGGSVIAAVTPMFNLMLESLVVWTNTDGGQETRVTVSPGFRLGWNLGEKQIVIGVGVPITRGDEHNSAILGYFSYELPFRRK